MVLNSGHLGRGVSAPKGFEFGGLGPSGPLGLRVEGSTGSRV